MNRVTIYTDGGCVPNPGKGSWAAILDFGSDVKRELSGVWHEPTTNNRMEVLAACMAFEHLWDGKHYFVRVFTDSMYLVYGARRWSNYMYRDGKPPKTNFDLFERLGLSTVHHSVEWIWVRGHHKCAENNRADALAENARKRNDCSR